MRYLKGIGIIVGLMFGAGIFALPYVVSKSGIFWGFFHFILAGVLTVFLLFLYARISYETPGNHRFSGYVELILGKGFKKFSFVATSLAYYGALLAYGLLGGIFLSNFFGGENAFILSILFFAVCSIITLMDLGKIALINFYLTIPLFGFVGYLVYLAMPFVDLNNFALSAKDMFLNKSWFLPYGVWLFAFSGMAAIPEARDIFSKSTFVDFKRVILFSILLSAVFYFLFVFSIVGVSGINTSPDALAGVLGVLGDRVILIGSMMGLLAIFTSFLSVAVDLRGVFHFDFGLPKTLSWFFVVCPPVALFLLGVQDLTRILSLVGSVGLGVSGTLIIMMTRKRYHKSKVAFLIMIGVLTAVFYEIWGVFF
ncbi:MAG: amino acid permease [Candidatus Marinimicrobia bacterium]|nr:amino acid permease [Candidatus Neomarinimicrobiota bacterium]